MARSIREERRPSCSFKPEVLLASFHGVPQDYVDKGDPYHGAVHRDMAAPAPRDGDRAPIEFRMSFQSRFGPAQWLQPYTDETIKSNGAETV